MAGFIIAAELAERRLVQVKQNLAQLLGCGITGGKTLSVYLTQCADERGSVLVVDFAIVVKMAIAETRLLMLLSIVPTSKHPPTGAKWQPCAATENYYGLIA